MGGCIANPIAYYKNVDVSSLYGRVYRFSFTDTPLRRCFLPVWEGVSLECSDYAGECQFPPCMGGCIGRGYLEHGSDCVSSLYGRVYRTGSAHVRVRSGFLPVWEGVSLC